MGGFCYLNCVRARQLISPYLDHQLSGRERDALQDHLTVCSSCDRERQSIRQVKMLLRGLSQPRLTQDFSRNFSETIAWRLEQPSVGPGWQVLTLTARPQRGRRLATALALSCLTVVSFALPFASDTHDTLRSPAFASGGSAFSLPVSSDALLSGQPADHILLVAPAPAGFTVPRGDVLPPADTETPVFTLHTSNMDMPLGSSQFAVFRPR